MTATLATTLDDAYRACDPDQPLEANDLRFVDLSGVRGTTVLSKTIARNINRQRDGYFHQQLLTGHRGCGKSTELLRLKAELELESYCVVYFDAGDQLDLGDLNYLDVLLGMAREIERHLRESGVVLNASLLDDLGQWFADHIVETDKSEGSTAELSTEAKAGTVIPFVATLMAKLTANIKLASSQRVIIRQKLEPQLPVFIQKLNLLITDARNKLRAQGQQDVVVIVDGLEKAHYRLMDDQQSTHAHLFVLHAEQLKAPQCHIIYTMPISLAYNANLGNDFDNPQVMPMVKMNDEGKQALRQLVANRLDVDGIFENPALLDKLIGMSGGVMRDLMRLIRFATETDRSTIGPDEITDACTSLVREYDRLTRDNEIEQMRFVHQNHRVQGDEAFARMLNLRIILEYQNGERWADLHPAVKAISWIKNQLG